MTGFLKARWKVIVLLLVTIVLGLYTKFYSGHNRHFVHWVNDSFSSVFYEIFWCLLAFLFFRKPKNIAITVFLATCCLEFLQLSHSTPLEFIRKYFIGRVLIGTSFVPSDFIYYFIGSGAGYVLMRSLSSPKTS